MTRPRVVFVDDDAALRRLAELSLEGTEVDLVVCDGAEAARAALRAGPARLLITDLMMPGESGIDLLRSLERDPALRGGARLAVFSAGLTADTRERLAGLDVWRVLQKPVTLTLLERCVADALQDAPASVVDGPASAEDTKSAADRADAVSGYFAGEQALFDAFLASCREQFAGDTREGDEALAAGDLPALRRLGHSLKNVLAMLGLPDGAAQARALERAALDGDAALTASIWAALRERLQALRA